MTQWSKLVHHLLFWPFYRISSICSYHWAYLTQSRGSICYCQDPSEASRSRHYQANLTALCRAFSLKTLPRATHSLSRGQGARVGILCLRGGKRTKSTFSQSLHGAVPTCTVTSWTQNDTPSKCIRTATCPFQTLPDPRRGFSWASTCPT